MTDMSTSSSQSSVTEMTDVHIPQLIDTSTTSADVAAADKRPISIEQGKGPESIPVVHTKTRTPRTAAQKRGDRDSRLRRAYGISLKDYERILAEQGGRCAICGARPRTKVLPVDHDKLTGKIRGLICYQCNHYLLRGCHEEIHILERAIEYLRQSLEVRT